MRKYVYNINTTERNNIVLAVQQIQSEKAVQIQSKLFGSIEKFVLSVFSTFFPIRKWSNLTLLLLESI